MAEREGNDPIVVVGMAVEAPGGVDTAEAYWSLLSSEREALGPFPTDRGWSVRDLLDGSRRDGFKRIHDLGGFLSGAATFDPVFFGISPREAVAMDPQQRVAMRVAWRALENSGINPEDLAGHDVGCYVGASITGYGPDMAEFSNHSGHLITGTALGVISGRIAYTLGLAGPAMTIDSSCASALAAFHVAVQSVRAGDCEMALAGGVCVMGSPGFFVEFSKQHALSDDGHCRPTARTPAERCGPKARRCSSCSAGRPRCGTGAECWPRSARVASIRTGARRADRAERAGAGATVPAGDRLGRRAARRHRHDRRPRHRQPGSATAPNCSLWPRHTARPSLAAARCSDRSSPTSATRRPPRVRSGWPRCWSQPSTPRSPPACTSTSRATKSIGKARV